ncbi:MAG: class I SAM-dependent methyltransferase [Armatimonadota bacterium]
MSSRTNPASFRDPDGCVFHRDGEIYRQVNHSYQSDYDLLMSSGLYAALTEKGLLIPHEEVGLEFAQTADAYRVLKPALVPFISYPYEWSFSQLKDAALLTLRLQKLAMKFGMSLKDCSAYNVQYVNGKPVFIDTLSFEQYPDGRPWVAYRQFCEHFLAPLALMSHCDIRLGQLLRDYIDGIPLHLASKLLPFRTHLTFSLQVHIHTHASFQKRYEGQATATEQAGRGVSRQSVENIVADLKSAVQRLQWAAGGTEWANYYNETNYTPAAFTEKTALVIRFIERVEPRMVWDLGGNVGVFSRLASDRGIRTISFDIDPAAVELNYQESRQKGETHILPLQLDLTNPSPGIGWANAERMSLQARGPVDLALALALIHHLAISHNLPLGMIAQYFASLCDALVIEFVPKSDSQVQRLLATREDIFPGYTQEHFAQEFGQYFTIIETAGISDSERTLFLMQRK